MNEYETTLCNWLYCDSLSVDNKEFNELPLEERKRILHHLIEYSVDEHTLQELFIKYMECEGNCDIFGPCECCGDVVYQYNLERKNYVSIHR